MYATISFDLIRPCQRKIITQLFHYHLCRFYTLVTCLHQHFGVADIINGHILYFSPAMTVPVASNLTVKPAYIDGLIRPVRRETR